MNQKTKALSAVLSSAILFIAVAGQLPASVVQADADPGSSLLLKYDFNEGSGTTAYDSSGNGYNGTLSSGASWAAGKNYGGVSLSGSNSYVTIPNGVLKNLTDITISMDVELNATNSNYWLTSLGSGTDNLVGMDAQTSALRGYYDNGGTTDQVSASSALTVGSWANVAIVISKADQKESIYVNGSLKTSYSISNISNGVGSLYSSSNTYSGYIGKSFWSGDAYVNASIDDYRIYGAALTAAQIAAIAASAPVSPAAATPAVVSTVPGKAPSLPATVDVPNTDGSNQALPVTWNAVTPDQYAGVGHFDVTGTTSSSPALTATAHVYVMTPPVLTSSAKTETSITLNWAAQSGAAAYDIYRSTTSGSGYALVKSITDGSTSYVDTGLSRSTTYDYVLAYTNAQGGTSVYSPELAVKTATEIVGPPADFAQAKYQYPYRVELNWSAADYADTYDIYRSDSSAGAFTKVANVEGTVFKDTAVQPGSTYYYKIASVNDAGEGALSGAVKAQTASDSVPPTTISVAGVTDSSATLHWEPVTGAESYTLYKTSTSGSAYSKVYSGTDTTYTEDNLITGATYYYVVTYTNGQGTSVYSNEVKAATDTVTVPAPSALKADGTYVGAVSFDWNSVVGADSFNIYKSTSKDGAYTKLANQTGNSYKDTGLDPSTTYYYKVSSVNGAGESGLSEPLAITTQSIDSTVWDNEAVKYDVDGNRLRSGGEGFLYYNGTYYMYSGVSNASGYSNALGCYSSKDLIHWKFENTVFSSDTTDAGGNHPAELTSGFKDERVKVIYDDSLKKFVMVFHYENAVDYSLGEITVSMSDSPTAPFTYVSTYHPDGMESRDMTLFKDDDGSVYLISSSNRASAGDGANSKLTLYKFAADYKSCKQLYNIYGGPDGNGQYAGREAPCIVKKDGKYYLITSNAAGWFPSQAMYSVCTADKLSDTTAVVLANGGDASNVWTGDSAIDSWEVDGKAYLVGNSTAFNSQSTYLMPVTGTHGTSYVLMSDPLYRPDTLGDQVWFPVQIDDGKLSFDYSATININTKTGEVSNNYPGSLISQGKPATASIEAAGHPASLANDGSYSTEWASTGATYPAWWQVDLGQEYNINNVQLSWWIIGGSEATEDYKIWVSDDGVNYTVAKDNATGSPNVYYGFNSDNLSNVTARYVKIEIIASHPRNNWSNSWYTPQLYEVKVYGEEAPASGSVTTPDSNGNYSYQIPSGIVNYPSTGNYQITVGNVSASFQTASLLNNLGHGALTFTNAKTSAETQAAIATASAADSEIVSTFDLNLTAADGTAIHNLGNPAAVTVQLTDDQAAQLKKQGTPKLFYYDPDTKSLVDLNAAFDLDKKTVSFSTTHFSSFVIELTGSSGTPTVDKTALQDLYDQAQAVDAAKYTSDSYAALQEAVKQAKAVLDNADATADDVNNALNALQTALDHLVSAGNPDSSSSPSNPSSPSSSSTSSGNTSEGDGSQDNPKTGYGQTAMPLAPLLMLAAAGAFAFKRHKKH